MPHEILTQILQAAPHAKAPAAQPVSGASRAVRAKCAVFAQGNGGSARLSERGLAALIRHRAGFNDPKEPRVRRNQCVACTVPAKNVTDASVTAFANHCSAQRWTLCDEGRLVDYSVPDQVVIYVPAAADQAAVRNLFGA